LALKFDYPDGATSETDYEILPRRKVGKGSYMAGEEAGSPFLVDLFRANLLGQSTPQ
jgi:hypothetical protein